MNHVTPALSIEGLTVAYRIQGELYDAIRDVSLQIYPGQVYGLVGESGSGKTTLAMAVMRYLGRSGIIRQGKIFFLGRDIVDFSPAEMQKNWGAKMTLVPQNPLASLNPSIRIGEQVAEILRTHLGMQDKESHQQTLDLLRRVRLPEPEVITESYPHQISGGMQQRVLIAMALCTQPRLLILDEPTASLDVTTQAVILDLTRELIQGTQTAVLYVSHNLNVIAQICDRVAVLYAGELVEDAALDDLFTAPHHPYTQGLLRSLPRLGQSKLNVSLEAIHGQIPPLGSRPSGCLFLPRCRLADQACTERPQLYQPVPGRLARCHYWPELVGRDSSRGEVEAAPTAGGIRINDTAHAIAAVQPLLSIQDLQVGYSVNRSLQEFLRRKPARRVKAVDGVSLEIPPAQTLGLVGESGSGKSSLARAIVGLVERTNGQVELLQVPLHARLSQRNIDTLRHLQMVFQNPEEALNPYQTVGASLRRPLTTLLGLTTEEANNRIPDLLRAVRLPAEYADRMPGQLSGGEKQRIAIARALASNPELLITDEAVSALDVSVQAAVLNLLSELQATLGTTLLFISHDLAVVTYISDYIAVIYLGELMQVSTAQDLLDPPYHPYTEALLFAIPVLNHQTKPPTVLLDGEIPSPVLKPSGCPFHTRCPRLVGPICQNLSPSWQETPAGKRIFCHIPIEELLAMQVPVERI